MACIQRRRVLEAAAACAHVGGHRQRAAQAAGPRLRETLDAPLAERPRGPRAADGALRGQGALGSGDQALEHRGSIYSRAHLMADAKPPSIDPAAAERWRHAAPPLSPWLHEEVGRRMAERLQWIKLEPQAWADWEPVRGGVEAHRIVAARYPRAQRWIAEHDAKKAEAARKAFANPWWRFKAAAHHGDAPDGAVQMLWANMALHMAADPKALLAKWHRALAVDGFLMFSCLGPDTLKELRALYASLGWPPPAHEFTDMHDWGDMLVHSGFAEPVMDMERITLTWPTAERMLTELRGLGANLNRDRFPALRARGWRRRLEEAAGSTLRTPEGSLALTFEIVYGHALKPAPRLRVEGESAISVKDMQALLRSGRKPG
jgi:malonyl-CoA O-methyltransferase